MSYPSMQAIAYQTNSRLADRLEELFQSVIDFRDNIERTSDDAQRQRSYVIAAVTKYCMNKMRPLFKDIIEKETGVIVKNLTLFGGVDEGLSYMFAVDISMGDPIAASKVFGDATSQYGYPYRTDDDIVEEIASMYESFDRTTGRYTQKTRKKLGPVSVNMYFDINTAFLLHEFIPKHAVDQFTARELAAIMMHETGHALSVIEHSGDTICSMLKFRDNIAAMKTNKNPGVTIKKLNTRLTPVMKKLSKDSSLSPEDRKKAEQIAKVLENTTKMLDAAPEEESWLYAIGGVTCHIIGIALVVIYTVLIDYITLWLINWGVTEIQRQSYPQERDGQKTGDTRTNYNNTFLLERWADEFVSRSGLGAELSSGLNKFHAAMEVSMISTVSSARLRNSSIFASYSVMMSTVLLSLNLASYTDPHGYENHYRRLRRIHQDTKGFFKDAFVAGPIRDLWYHNLESIEQQMASAKRLIDTEVGEALINTYLNLMSPGRWVINIIDGNVDRDTEIIANRVDDLSNNALYAQSSRLSRR